MKVTKIMLVMMASLALLLMAGCQGQTAKDTASVSGSSSAASSGSSDRSSSAAGAKAKQASASEMTIKVYYPDQDGERLLSETRKVKTDPDKYTAALQALLSGPESKGHIAIIPKQAKLNSVTVKDGVAKADFSQELIKKFSGGSTGEEMLVGSIIDTLTEFPEVKKVQILVGGKAVETIAGHMDLSSPIARMSSLLK
jgi:spore germination protein GerM